MSHVDRRKALLLLASLGGLSALPRTRTTFAAGLPGSLDRFEEGLDVEAAARLGREYLRKRPGDSDVDRLLDELAGGDAANPTAFLAEKVQRDFGNGNVVELRDWQVSVTEARIFAAIALLK